MDDKNKEESTPEDTGKGSEPETNTLVEDTNLAAKRLEEATKEAREERLAREESYAKMKLGGVAEAGQSPKEETEDEKWAKGAKERYAGTGMDPTDDDTPTEFK